MLNTTLPPWPSFSAAEARAVADVITSNRVNYWTGEECRNFEKEFSAWCGSESAIALSNGTVALDLALKALGVGPGDEVIVTPRTFIASISCVVTAGATPVFADVDLDTGNISPDTIAPKITRKTKAIIPVHLAGWPCDMDGILLLARANGIKVIEDCAQAHGARIGNRSVGTMGDIGAWSFCQDKIMTTGGEGGMVTTDDHELWSTMWSYKDHGKSWDAVYNKQHPPGYRWLHESFGTNWRMLEVQGVLGRLQLKQMSEWTVRRTQIAHQMMAVLDQFPNILRVPRPGADVTHAYYRLYAYVQPETLASGWTRDRIVAECSAQGAPVFQGSCSEVYLEKAFDSSCFRPHERLPNARALGENSLMFLTHPNITDEDVGRVCEVFEHVFRDASRAKCSPSAPMAGI
jgi:dTDP-4-amino-4,6-dideoxygalactose transaminase